MRVHRCVRSAVSIGLSTLSVALSLALRMDARGKVEVSRTVA